VIADIHGCSRTFEQLLLRSKLRKNDTLYLLGDYVDRGPDSCGVLTQIMGLLENGYDVRPLRGNHDDMMLRTYKNTHDNFSDYWLLEWGVDVIRSFGVKDHVRKESWVIAILF
jgi:serine/threonine protein phosphatase 1